MFLHLIKRVQIVSIIFNFAKIKNLFREKINVNN